MPIPEHPTVLFLSHGGGPMPILGDDAHREMVDGLTAIAAEINKPSAIIVVSAHWENEVAAITHGARPPLIYDYYGFPDAAYNIEYPAPGAPQLAERIHAALADRHFQAKLDPERGFDHGLFIPLLLMYPDADIPCVQVSLLANLDPADHIRMGEALAESAEDGVLIVGSGFSFHNMKAFFQQDTAQTKAMNEAFEAWLLETCSSRSIDEADRAQRLIDWESAPSARYCHPREEHLLPLHVCYGAAKRPCSRYFQLSILNKKSSMYLW
jgi:aromatic ring-opening dioxygenase catalytic subunit (LigB family)